MDAILAFADAGNPVEPEWPEADVVIGNPPFLGGKLLRTELGREYVDWLFTVWDERVARESDLCCYWFEKARSLIEGGQAQRVGLLATQGIRGSANRTVLQRIKTTGDIFWAQSDRNWILDGATVHVSMVGFDDGREPGRELDGEVVQHINANLTSSLDLTEAKKISENSGIAFMGVTPAGKFSIPGSLARRWLSATGNPNGCPNSDVLKPYFNGIDLNRNQRDVWTIDFGTAMPIEHACLYELPFQYVQENIRPIRIKNKRRQYAEKWWLFAEPRPAMRSALSPLPRYVGISLVSKHMLVSWLGASVVPANLLIVFAREDDYFFGVLHSKIHELWARRQGT